MSGNPFDQFDTPTATPVAAPSDAPPVSTNMPSQNPFDQFDAPQAAQPTTPTIATHAQDADLSGDAPIVITGHKGGPAQTAPIGYQLHGDFADTMERHANQLPPDVEKNVVNILSTHPIDTAAADARAYLAPMGIYPTASTNSKFGDNFDQVIDYRRQHGTVSDSVISQLMAPKQAAAIEGASTNAGGTAVRGAADAATAGLVSHIDSGLHAAADTISGNSPNGFVNDYNRWEDVNQSILQGDEANHPYARLTGQLIGGMALPTGTEGAALEAGKSVLVAGGTMREARAAAAAAARSRIAAEGAAYGGVHGAATGGPVGAVTGAVTGGVAGYGLAAGGQALGIGAKAAIPSATDEAATAAVSGSPDYAQIARELSVQRTPATNSRLGVSTAAQAALSVLPGGNPVTKGVTRENEGLANAASDIAQGVGQVSDRQGAGTGLAQGAAEYKANSGEEAKGLYQTRDELIGGQGAPVPTNNAAAALQDMSTRFPNSQAIQQLNEHPTIRAIGAALPGKPTTEEVPTGVLDANGNPVTRTVTSGGEPLTLGEVTEALSHVRGVQRNLAAQSNTTSPMLARVNQLEQALENDVTNAARNADVAAGRTPGAEGSALKAQQDADAFYADRAQALNGSLKRPLQSAKDETAVSGESVYNQVSGDMDAKTGNLARLRDTWFRLPTEAKNTFAATKIDDMGRALPGQQNDHNTAWSFQTFLTNFNRLSPQSRNIVFGAKADDQLQQIATYAARLRQIDKFRNFSNTARNYLSGALGAAILGPLTHGHIGDAAEAASAVAGTWTAAKVLMATPAMRDWTTSALKAAVDGNENAANVLVKKLPALAASQPAFASDIGGLQQMIQHANDNSAFRSAASQSQSPQDNQRSKAITAP